MHENRRKVKFTPNSQQIPKSAVKDLCASTGNDVMDKYFQPTKEQVREYLRRRFAEHSPPPDVKEIRRQLGFELLKAQRHQGTR